MKMGKYVLTALMVIGIAGMVYAAPVGLTSEADATKAEWSYENITMSAGLIVDSVVERRIDVSEGKFEINAVLTRIGVSLIDRINLYLDLGQANDMSYDCEVNTTTSVVKYEYDDEFMWGVGINALLYRWDNGLEIGAGASYRTADMAIDKVTIDSVTYQKADLDSVREGEYEESQIALEVAWKTDYFIPYVGMKYSDVEVAGDVTNSAVVYNATGKNASENLGVFAGLTVVPEMLNEQLAINIEGRLIDEEAFNIGVTYKF